MSGFSEDFLRFLYYNFPDDYRKASVKDLPEDVKESILKRQESNYKIWSNIPEWIREEYANIIPKDVLHGNVPVKEFIEDEYEKLEVEQKETQELVQYGISLAALGYAAESVAALVQNRAKRAELLAHAPNGKLSEADMKAWLKTREQDIKVVREDWQKNQSEKYLVHLIKEINRNNKMMLRSSSESEKAALSMKKSALERELKGYAYAFTEKEKSDKLITYLRQPAQQSAVKHISPDILQKFVDVLSENGIKIKMSEGNKKQIEVKRMNLFDEMKSHFEKRKALIESVLNKNMHTDEDFSALHPDVVNLRDKVKKEAAVRHGTDKKEQQSFNLGNILKEKMNGVANQK